MERVSNSLGRVRISTVPLPDGLVNTYYGHFTFTGSVLFCYTPAGAEYVKDYYRLGVMRKDGTCFRKVFEGMIPTVRKANGIRFLPLRDNKRIITGDYMIECSPDIDHCEHAQVFRIFYPEGLWEDPGTMQSWTEIIMAPDCVHIAWTTIRADIGAVNFYGRLVRDADSYHVEDPQIISNLENFEKDKAGRLCAVTATGGELKQFIRGGRAISFAGSDRAGTLDSMVQSLEDGSAVPITRTPGYDETTIFSPDEKLGLVMTTRFSPKTDGRIFSIVPRPLKANPTLGLAMAIYTFAVMDVRQHRMEGSIGPALVEIEKSMTEKGYLGICLEPEEEETKWAFNSPMSWHPDGKCAMWNEVDRTKRSEDGFGVQRIRIAELPDYEPGETVGPADCPDVLSFAKPWSMDLIQGKDAACDLSIAGAAGGTVRHIRSGNPKGYETVSGVTETIYDHYSEDGVRVWNGFEKVSYAPVGETIYEADLTVKDGDVITGEMHMKVVYTKPDFHSPYRVDRTPDGNGKPRSFGYARYENETVRVQDMAD